MTHSQPQPEQTVAEILTSLGLEYAEEEARYIENKGRLIRRPIKARNAEAKAALNRQALATALRLIGSDYKMLAAIKSKSDAGAGEVNGVNAFKAELRQAFTDYYGITDEEQS